VSRYQKGKTNLDFTEARDSEWQWRQLGRMQVCTSLQTDNHASTPPLSFLQAGCPSCHPTNSVNALKALKLYTKILKPGLVAFDDVLYNGCDVVSYVYHLPVADDLISFDFFHLFHKVKRKELYTICKLQYHQ